LSPASQPPSRSPAPSEPSCRADRLASTLSIEAVRSRLSEHRLVSGVVRRNLCARWTVVTVRETDRTQLDHACALLHVASTRRETIVIAPWVETIRDCCVTSNSGALCRIQVKRRCWRQTNRQTEGCCHRLNPLPTVWVKDLY